MAVPDAPLPDPRWLLLVDSDRDLGQGLVAQLAADGYRARLALSTAHARALACGDPPLLAIIGCLDSPRGALELLAEIRRGEPWKEDLPVIVLGSPAHILDLLRAFEAGADDFLARPPGYLELRARLRALLRRAGRPPPGSRLQVGALRLDTRARSVLLHDREVSLRRMEYELLLHLAGDPTRVFAKYELLQAVWGHRVSCSTRTLDSHASRLRRKLADADTVSSQRWVVNVRGVGYRLR